MEAGIKMSGKYIKLKKDIEQLKVIYNLKFEISNNATNGNRELAEAYSDMSKDLRDILRKN